MNKIEPIINSSFFSGINSSSFERESLEVSFWKVFKNKYIFDQVFSNFKRYDDYYTDIYVVNYILGNYENGQEILKDKVKSNSHLVFKNGKEDLKLIYSTIKKEMPENKQFYHQLFKRYKESLFNNFNETLADIIESSNILAFKEYTSLFKDYYQFESNVKEIISEYILSKHRNHDQLQNDIKSLLKSVYKEYNNHFNNNSNNSNSNNNDNDDFDYEYSNNKKKIKKSNDNSNSNNSNNNYINNNNGAIYYSGSNNSKIFRPKENQFRTLYSDFKIIEQVFNYYPNIKSKSEQLNSLDEIVTDKFTYVFQSYSSFKIFQFLYQTFQFSLERICNFKIDSSLFNTIKLKQLIKINNFISNHKSINNNNNNNNNYTLFINDNDLLLKYFIPKRIINNSRNIISKSSSFSFSSSSNTILPDFTLSLNDFNSNQLNSNLEFVLKDLSTPSASKLFNSNYKNDQYYLLKKKVKEIITLFSLMQEFNKELVSLGEFYYSRDIQWNGIIKMFQTLKESEFKYVNHKRDPSLIHLQVYLSNINSKYGYSKTIYNSKTIEQNVKELVFELIKNRNNLVGIEDMVKNDNDSSGSGLLYIFQYLLSNEEYTIDIIRNCNCIELLDFFFINFQDIVFKDGNEYWQYLKSKALLEHYESLMKSLNRTFRVTFINYYSNSNYNGKKLLLDSYLKKPELLNTLYKRNQKTKYEIYSKSLEESFRMCNEREFFALLFSIKKNQATLSVDRIWLSNTSIQSNRFIKWIANNIIVNKKDISSRDFHYIQVKFGEQELYLSNSSIDDYLNNKEYLVHHYSLILDDSIVCNNKFNFIISTQLLLKILYLCGRYTEFYYILIENIVPFSQQLISSVNSTFNFQSPKISLNLNSTFRAAFIKELINLYSINYSKIDNHSISYFKQLIDSIFRKEANNSNLVLFRSLKYSGYLKSDENMFIENLFNDIKHNINNKDILTFLNN